MTDEERQQNEAAGKRIKELRESKGMKRPALAEIIGVDPNTLYRYETGLVRIKDVIKRKIAKALDTSVAYLVGETNDSKRHATLLTDDDRATGNPSPDDFLNLANIRYPEFVKVPLLDIKTCAGLGSSHMFEDVEEIGTRFLDAKIAGVISIYEEKRPFAVLIDGDSMSAAGMPDGIEITINPAEEVHSGDAAMVCFGENLETAIKWVYFKPNGAIELRSATPGFPIYEYTKEQQLNPDNPLIIIGKVVYVGGPPKRGV